MCVAFVLCRSPRIIRGPQAASRHHRPQDSHCVVNWRRPPSHTQPQVPTLQLQSKSRVRPREREHGSKTQMAIWKWPRQYPLNPTRERWHKESTFCRSLSFLCLSSPKASVTHRNSVNTTCDNGVNYSMHSTSTSQVPNDPAALEM